MALFSGPGSKTAANRPPNARHGVLLVDDEALNLDALAALLEDEYDVHRAGDGRQALQVLAASSAAIQIVVSDQRMPGMSGVELLTRIRQSRPDIKGILLTGYNDLDAVVRAINEAGIYRYMQKPVEVHELRLTLARACEAWQLEQDNRELVAALSRSYERLAALDAAKTSFLRYLAHEINTPLNWLAAAQVIDARSLGEESRRMLAYVDEGRERLYGLVGAVLRYFEAAGGELHTEPEQVELRGHIGRVLADAQALAESRDDGSAQVPVRIEGRRALVIETDAGLLAELLSHLVENALTHAARGGKDPVACIELSEAGGGVEIAVHNSGRTPGEAVLAQLFEPFFFCGSLHGAHGYGLSLATARVLATSLGGSLTASSTGTASGDGLVLRLRLPLRLSARGTSGQAEAAVTAAGHSS